MDRPASQPQGLLSGSLWNVAGTAAPALVSVPAMGIMARALGPEGFGLLTLAWGLAGYFAVLDLGVARSVCWLVARYPDDAGLHGRVLASAVAVSLGVGGALGFVLLALSHHVPALLGVSPAMAADALAGARLVVPTLPLLTLTTVLQAVLEGKQYFREVNLQRSVVGLLLAIAPLALVLAHPTFSAAVAGLLLARVAGALLAWARLRRLTGLPALGLDRSALVMLFRYAGWIALSNFIGPLMSYADRFWLSARVGAAAVSTYSAPAELVGRVAFVPVAIARALFPGLSRAGSPYADRAASVRRAFLLILGSSGPLALVLLAFADPVLRVWVGPEVAAGGAPVLRILAVGHLCNALAQVPYSVLQARGNARATALVHGFELIPYFALLLFLGVRHGAVGVAAAWTLRVAFDLLVLTFLARARRR